MPLNVLGLCPLLQVFDMPTALAFYRDALGFDVLETAPPLGDVEGDDFGWVWLRHGNTDLMLNTAYDSVAVRPTRPDRARVAAHEDITLFLGCPDLPGAYAFLQERGLEVEPPTTTISGMTQLMLKDPDGYTLCLQWTAEGADVSRV